MTTATLMDLFEEVDVIHIYTRKEALADGVQVALTDELAKTASHLYKFPVYLTGTVHRLIEEAVSVPDNANSYEGVLWDILYMSRVMSRKVSESASVFTVVIYHEGSNRYHDMQIECQPIDVDNPAPCLTVSMVGED